MPECAQEPGAFSLQLATEAIAGSQPQLKSESLVAEKFSPVVAPSIVLRRRANRVVAVPAELVLAATVQRRQFSAKYWLAPGRRWLERKPLQCQERVRARRITGYDPRNPDGRRVAEFFEVEFEFWLDDGLAVTKQLDLLQESGVPKDHRKEYGEDTIWPTALVVDPSGIIRYTELSKFIADRPNPKSLLRELRTALDR